MEKENTVLVDAISSVRQNQSKKSALQKSFMKLDVQYRKVLFDLILNGRKDIEVANELGISCQAINRRKKAALAVLQAELLEGNMLTRADWQVIARQKLDKTLFN